MQLKWRNISSVLNVSTINWVSLRELKYTAGRGYSVEVCSLRIRLNIKWERKRQHAFQESFYCLLNRIYKISTMTIVNTGSRSFNWRAGKPPGRMDKDVLLLIGGITRSLIASWLEHLGFIREVLRLQLILNLVVLIYRAYKLPRATFSPPDSCGLGGTGAQYTVRTFKNKFNIFFNIKPFRALCHYNLVTGTNKQSYSNLNY